MHGSFSSGVLLGSRVLDLARELCCKLSVPEIWLKLVQQLLLLSPSRQSIFLVVFQVGGGGRGKFSNFASIYTGKL